MEEQSHKDEMRAALRGDFERMRQRHAGEGETVDPAVAPASVTPEEPRVAVREALPGSWLDRLLGRA